MSTRKRLEDLQKEKADLDELLASKYINHGEWEERMNGVREKLAILSANNQSPAMRELLLAAADNWIPKDTVAARVAEAKKEKPVASVPVEEGIKPVSITEYSERYGSSEASSSSASSSAAASSSSSGVRRIVDLGAGRNFTKMGSSHCVINIIPPRSTWGKLQQWRTESTPEQRCGPHLSFIDPFVVVDRYAEAAAMLEQALAEIPPFTMRLEKFDFFAFKSSATAFITPTIEPEGALDALIDAILRVFPQCNDQIKKSKTGKFVPHFSAYKFKNASQCEAWIRKSSAEWKPITCKVNHIYLLWRNGGDPFETRHAVPLGGNTEKPDYGLGSVDPKGSAHDRAVARSMAICNIPRDWNETQIISFLGRSGLSEVEALELNKNPNGKSRGLAVASFKSADAASAACKRFNADVSAPAVYVRMLELMTYPDIIGGSTKLKKSK